MSIGPQQVDMDASTPLRIPRDKLAKARLAKELLATCQDRGMSREGLIKRLESLVRSKKTPTQYIAPLSSLLAELNMWKRRPDDDKSKISIDESLNAWKREDGGAYAGLMNQVRSDNGAICQPGDAHADSPPNIERATPDSHQSSVMQAIEVSGAQAGSVGSAPGGSPQAESAAESLDPLTTRHSPEKPLDVVDSKQVNPNQPEDGWME